MKLEVTVAEIADIFKVIQERPEQLFEMIRLDIRDTVGKYLTSMMETELTHFETFEKSRINYRQSNLEGIIRKTQIIEVEISALIGYF